MDFFWEKNQWEQQDKHLVQLYSGPFQREVPFIPSKSGLYIIRGPRQVGKSSWLKKILAHHVSNGTKCFYLSCEEVSSYKELGEILRIYKDRKVILLDEISFIPGWERAIKHFIDASLEHILVITGSHAYDLRKGADQMPGRFGGGGEFFLLPMEFHEFQKARNDAGWSTGNRLEELKTYLRVGGFPLAVIEAGPQGVTPHKAIETYQRWLFGDVLKLNKNTQFLQEILIQIGRTLQTPLSFQSFAQKTSIGSHTTVQEYIELLESCFAVRSLLAINADTDQFHFKKNRKFYFTDPLLLHLALSLAGKTFSAEYEPGVAEQVAHEALARRYKRFGYYSSRQGEIDFLAPKKWGLEVKWGKVQGNLSKAYTNTVLPWKLIWSAENFLEELPPQT